MYLTKKVVYLSFFWRSLQHKSCRIGSSDVSHFVRAQLDTLKNHALKTGNNIHYVCLTHSVRLSVRRDKFRKLSFVFTWPHFPVMRRKIKNENKIVSHPILQKIIRSIFFTFFRHKRFFRKTFFLQIVITFLWKTFIFVFLSSLS